jgi:hypothetical protein
MTIKYFLDTEIPGYRHSRNIIIIKTLFNLIFLLSISKRRKEEMGNKPPTNTPPRSIFEFSVENELGEPIKLSNFSGKNAYLVVNVASK